MALKLALIRENEHNGNVTVLFTRDLNPVVEALNNKRFHRKSTAAQAAEVAIRELERQLRQEAITLA